MWKISFFVFWFPKQTIRTKFSTQSVWNCTYEPRWVSNSRPTTNYLFRYQNNFLYIHQKPRLYTTERHQSGYVVSDKTPLKSNVIFFFSVYKRTGNTHKLTLVLCGAAVDILWWKTNFPFEGYLHIFRRLTYTALCLYFSNLWVLPILIKISFEIQKISAIIHKI